MRVLGGACRVNRVWATFNLVNWGHSQNEHACPGAGLAWPAPWEKRAEAHMALLIVQASQLSLIHISEPTRPKR